MKILRIQGKNLASIAEEFDIDFTAAPLRSAGIFAICGPTGAGKTTMVKLLMRFYDVSGGAILLASAGLGALLLRSRRTAGQAGGTL